MIWSSISEAQLSISILDTTYDGFINRDIRRRREYFLYMELIGIVGKPALRIDLPGVAIDAATVLVRTLLEAECECVIGHEIDLE